MMSSPGFFWTILSFILIIGPLIFVHEMGHFLVARWFGVKVETFSIGFGRELTGWTDRLGTRWKIAWMPLGGYVRFVGDMNGASMEDAQWRQLPAQERANIFHAKPLGQRALIVAAGPIANLLAAVLILAGFAYAYGEPHRPPVVALVMQDSPAARAGLAPGDRILEVSGRKIENFEDIYPLVQDRPGMSLSITYVRDGRNVTTEMTSDVVISKDRFGNEYRIGRIGLLPVAEQIVRDLSPAQSLVSGVIRTGAIIDRMATGIWQVVTGRRSAAELGGPIKIAKISGEAAELGWQPFIYLAAMISINLGFINLLPVPMLDGGHLSFYAVEAIQRRPVHPRTMEIAFRSGMYALLALMLFVTFNDLAALDLGRLTRLGG